MVLFLSRLVRAVAHAGGAAVHHGALGVHARDYPALADWGLAVTEERGVWRPTVAGLEFMRGSRRVPKYRFYYDAASSPDPDSPLVGVTDVWRDEGEWRAVVQHQAVVDFFARELDRRQGVLL